MIKYIALLFSTAASTSATDPTATINGVLASGIRPTGGLRNSSNCISDPMIGLLIIRRRLVFLQFAACLPTVKITNTVSEKSLCNFSASICKRLTFPMHCHSQSGNIGPLPCLRFYSQESREFEHLYVFCLHIRYHTVRCKIVWLSTLCKDIVY